MLYSDNGGEFFALKQFLATNGISHFTTPPHTLEHNGMAELKHRHIVETGLSLLTYATIPNTYWTYSFVAAIYLINRLITPNLSKFSPYHLLFKREPNYTKLRTFGCLCYPCIRPYSQNKFSSKSVPCVFLGYSLTQSAYLCLDVSTSRVYVSRHVEFVESVFPFSSLSRLASSFFSSLEPSISDFSQASLVPVFNWSLTLETIPCTDHLPVDSVSSRTTQESLPETSDASSSESSSAATSLSQTEHSVSRDSVTSVVPMGLAPVPNTHLMVTRAKSNIRKPNPKYGLTAILHEVEPENHIQALKDEKWRRAISEEADAFIRNDTFDMVDRSLAKNMVGSKWVFRIK